MRFQTAIAKIRKNHNLVFFIQNKDKFKYKGINSKGAPARFYLKADGTLLEIADWDLNESEIFSDKYQVADKKDISRLEKETLTPFKHE